MGDCRKSDLLFGCWPYCAAELSGRPCEKRSWVARSARSLWRQEFIVSLVATRFHLVEGMCKLKTRTHNSNTRTHDSNTCTHNSNTCTHNSNTCTHKRAGVGSFFLLHLSLLVATRFHLVEGMCKLKTRTHNSNTCTHKRARGGLLFVLVPSPPGAALRDSIWEIPGAERRPGYIAACPSSVRSDVIAISPNCLGGTRHSCGFCSSTVTAPV